MTNTVDTRLLSFAEVLEQARVGNIIGLEHATFCQGAYDRLVAIDALNDHAVLAELQVIAEQLTVPGELVGCGTATLYARRGVFTVPEKVPLAVVFTASRCISHFQGGRWHDDGKRRSITAVCLGHSRGVEICTTSTDGRESAFGHLVLRDLLAALHPDPLRAYHAHR